MIEVLRTNDPVVLSLAEAILLQGSIDHFVADRYMSTLEGSSGFLQRRILVASDQLAQARRLLSDAGLASELKRG